MCIFVILVFCKYFQGSILSLNRLFSKTTFLVYDRENNEFSQHLNRINDDDETVVDVLEMDLITEVADDEMHPSW